MRIEFSGEIWFWKGPAPWHFVTVPEDDARVIETAAAAVSYGWGMIPVHAEIGRTRWTTSLFPKDGRYVLPLRTDVRRAERLELGAAVSVSLTVDV